MPTNPLQQPLRGVVRVESLTVSLDGYGAGPDQSLGSPLGQTLSRTA